MRSTATKTSSRTSDRSILHSDSSRAMRFGTRLQKSAVRNYGASPATATIAKRILTWKRSCTTEATCEHDAREPYGASQDVDSGGKACFADRLRERPGPNDLSCCRRN